MCWLDRVKEGQDFGKILGKCESIRSEFSPRNFVSIIQLGHYIRKLSDLVEC